MRAACRVLGEQQHRQRWPHAERRLEVSDRCVLPAGCWVSRRTLQHSFRGGSRASRSQPSPTMHPCCAAAGRPAPPFSRLSHSRQVNTEGCALGCAAPVGQARGGSTLRFQLVSSPTGRCPHCATPHQSAALAPAAKPRHPRLPHALPGSRKGDVRWPRTGLRRCDPREAHDCSPDLGALDHRGGGGHGSCPARTLHLPWIRVHSTPHPETELVCRRLRTHRTPCMWAAPATGACALATAS